jgi:hypothetical protein
MKKNLFYLIAGTAVILSSCDGEQTSGPKVYDYEKEDSLNTTYTSNLGNIRVSIEQTAELNKTMKEGGISFNGSVLNSPGKASGYSSSKAQALNLGVYSSDLNYAVAYDQGQDAMNYIKAVMQLSQKLGIEKAFNEEMIQKLSEADTTVDKSILLTRAYRHAQDQLQSNQRAQLATLMVVGGWIESLYITTSLLKDKETSGQVKSNVWDIAFAYTNVVEMLEVFKSSNQDCAEVREDIKVLAQPLDDLFRARQNIQTVHIQKVHEAISSVRQKIVG